METGTDCVCEYVLFIKNLAWVRPANRRDYNIRWKLLGICRRCSLHLSFHKTFDSMVVAVLHNHNNITWTTNHMAWFIHIIMTILISIYSCYTLTFESLHFFMCVRVVCILYFIALPNNFPSLIASMCRKECSKKGFHIIHWCNCIELSCISFLSNCVAFSNVKSIHKQSNHLTLKSFVIEWMPMKPIRKTQHFDSHCSTYTLHCIQI